MGASFLKVQSIRVSAQPRVTSLSGAARNGVVFGATDDGCTIQLSEGPSCSGLGTVVGLGVAISSPIGFREFSEDEYRKFIRSLSDEELIEAGKRLRILCGDVVTATPCAFDEQLKICREEYWRRHPKQLT